MARNTATITVEFNGHDIRAAFDCGANAMRDGVLRAARERLAGLALDSPEASAWRDVEAAVAALESPRAPEWTQ